MVHEHAQRLLVHALEIRRQLRIQRAHEMLHEERDVLAPLAKRRQEDVHHVQAVEEVFAEAPGLDLLAQVPIGAREDAHVGEHGLGGAHCPDALLLEHAQELHLHVERQVSDLVEVDGAALGGDEKSGASLQRARESPAHVPEELALEQRLGNRPAVNGNERLRASRAGGVHGARGELLAGAALARDEDAARRGADLGDLRAHAAHGRALAQQALLGPVILDAGRGSAH